MRDELPLTPFLVALATWSLFSVCVLAFAVRYRGRRRRPRPVQLTDAERARFNDIAAHLKPRSGDPTT